MYKIFKVHQLTVKQMDKQTDKEIKPCAFSTAENVRNSIPFHVHIDTIYVSMRNS